MYFGATLSNPSQVSGVSDITLVQSPLITNDFTFNGSLITTYQMPYNTFYAVDTPIVLSAVDTANIELPRLYFSLLNNVTLYNGPNYNG
jgi:ABC-type tungstate transport system permease subunit